MVDEADRRLGSSDWGGPASLGHPECFPPKGQLYTLLRSGLCMSCCACVCLFDIDYWQLSRDIAGATGTLYCALTCGGLTPHLAAVTFTPRSVAAPRHHCWLRLSEHRSTLLTTNTLDMSTREGRETDFQPVIKLPFDALMCVTQALLILKQTFISII